MPRCFLGNFEAKGPGDIVLLQKLTILLESGDLYDICDHDVMMA
jgi:hypothetical protein